jgi:hypothetical protein
MILLLSFNRNMNPNQLSIIYIIYIYFKRIVFNSFF